MKRLSNGKAPGADSISAEIYAFGGPIMSRKLCELFESMWKQELIPQELKDAFIVHLYKRKRNPQTCDNHRGISLLSIAGKILARVLLNRLIDHLEDGLLPESQCGFRPGRGPAEIIFAARKIMAKFGCPAKFSTMVRQLHDGRQARVQDDGLYSKSFPVTIGVKHQQKNLIVDPFIKFKPVQISQNRNYVIIFSGACNEPGCFVIQGLGSVFSVFREPCKDNKERIRNPEPIL